MVIQHVVAPLDVTIVVGVRHVEIGAIIVEAEAVADTIVMEVLRDAWVLHQNVTVVIPLVIVDRTNVAPVVVVPAENSYRDAKPAKNDVVVND